MIQPAGQQPSIRGIFAWAHARFFEHWRGLFAIALVPGLIPATRMAIAHQHTPKSSPAVGWTFAMIGELLLLLCTAAMMLLVLRPKGARGVEAAREALADAPQLVLAKITTSLVYLLPAFALAAVSVGLHGGGTLLFGLLLAPLGFLSRLAFAGAVIERSGPIGAIQDAFRRARLSGFGIVVALTLLFGIIEQVPPLIILHIANGIFPPPEVPISFPQVPGHTIPQPAFPFPGMTMPGPLGSAIPWGAHVVMLLADMPFFAYLTVLYAGAALAFADTEPAPPVDDQPLAPTIIS